MAEDLPKVNIAVKDRVLLHLLEESHQIDRFVVTFSLTRPGIAEACAQHPPNVSRAMRNLLKEKMVTEHTRSIKGDERRQKTWQLTEKGIEFAENRKIELSLTKVLLRDNNGTLLEIEANEAPSRLNADLTLLQVLLHAQHEGVLIYGDIRFGLVRKSDESEDEKPPPGRLTLLAGAHATYHTAPPQTRQMHGREDNRIELDDWFSDRRPCLLVHGIAGIGKSTLVANWLQDRMKNEPLLSVCWYPCQSWDNQVGLATSLLHRFGVDDVHDPYHLMETLPLTPGADFDIDSWRRRLLAYLTDAATIRERFKLEAGGPPPYWLIVLDDVHHISDNARDLLGALIDIAMKSPLRIAFISRTTLDIYDRRDVHIREVVREIPLKGLSIDEIEEWIKTMDGDPPSPEEIFRLTGGHPLALELLEIYGKTTHGDWLRFLDEEIITHMPTEEYEMLATLALSDKPIPWAKLSKSLGWSGKPPERLITYGLLIELEEGMWLHEALRERFLREVGENAENRRAKLRN